MRNYKNNTNDLSDLPSIKNNNWEIEDEVDNVAYIYNKTDSELSEDNFISIMLINNKYCIDICSEKLEEQLSNESLFPMVAESYIHEYIEILEEKVFTD